MPIYEPMRAAWQLRPFQGQNPENAKVLFFGKDANYDSHITNAFLAILRQYHEDGPAYWLNNCQNNNNDHHPFLLPVFGQGAGYLYHDTFRQIKLPGQRCAHAISFIELLNVPTTDIIGEAEFSQLLQNSFEDDHIMRLQNAIFNGRNKLVFVCNEVIQNLKTIKERHGFFNALDYSFKAARDLPPIYTDQARNITVRKYIHLSAHRFHRKQVLAQLPILRQLILHFLNALEPNENRNCQQTNRGDRE